MATDLNDENPTLFTSATLVEPLAVYREIHGRYQLTGTLSPSESGARFAYGASYLAEAGDLGEPARPISTALPLQTAPFTEAQTRRFFENLLPEGEVRRILEGSARNREASYPRLLRALNDESSGALVFAESSDDPWKHQSYEPIGQELLDDFSLEPSRVASELDLMTHLSLAGAEAKIGLYHQGNDPRTGWFQPRGTAPTTHIVKAGSPLYPDEAINEALCLETARRCGFDVEDSFLIPIEGRDPLLAARRFDRVFTEDGGDPRLTISGMPRPERRHQEDMLQALSLPSYMKYEATGQPNSKLVFSLLSTRSADPVEDRMRFFRLLVFDLLVGNCDNHLKNHSLLWDGDWRNCKLSPVYDVVNTRGYGFYPEMAIAFSESRRIDDVTWDDVTYTAWTLGFGASMAVRLFDEVAERFLGALREAENSIAEQGFEAVRGIAAFIALEAKVRLDRIAASQV